jgi:signal transduction histidine kinase
MANRSPVTVCANGPDPASALDLERARREVFVSTLAHELRQPLSTLMAATNVARLTEDAEAMSRAVHIMTRQIDQMSRLIDDLVDAVRWAHGTMALRKQQLDVRDVIANAALDIAAAVADRRQQLVVTSGDEPLWVNADPQRIQQVLSNLLRNAVKFTDPGGRLSIVAARGPTTVTVRVSDTGRGIEPDALERIFDLFSQVRPSGTEGLGIGLSVVREIVTLHDGWIHARSEGPGRGSEFVVTLPLAGPLAPWASQLPNRRPLRMDTTAGESSLEPAGPAALSVARPAT